MNKKAYKALLLVSAQCAAHASSCTRCCVPIMDAEGNPGYVGEACKTGADLLTEYRRIEKLYFA